MALHVTHVAIPSLTVPAASNLRSPVGSFRAGQLAATEAETDQAPQAAPSFQSWLARSSAGEEPAAAIDEPTGKRPATAVATATASTAGTATASSSTSTSTTATNGLSDFELLFGGSSYNPADPMAASETSSAAPSTAAVAAPTAQSVFGPNVFMTDPIGLNPDGSSFPYNPYYFATESTAQTVANMIGGTVVAKDMFTQPVGDAFVQQQPNYMVQMPNGALINPGLVASFYTFGFPQSQINTMIGQEVANTPPPTQTA